MEKRFVREYAAYVLEQIKPCAAYKQACERVERAIDRYHFGYISTMEVMGVIHNIPAWCESVLADR